MSESNHHHTDHLCGDHDRCLQFNGHSGNTRHHHHSTKEEHGDDMLIHEHNSMDGYGNLEGTTHKHYLDNEGGYYDEYGLADHDHAE